MEALPLQLIPASRYRQWDQYASTAEDGGLLQSFAWGEFHQALGNQVFRILEKDNVWACQAIKLRAGKNFVLQIPRGPICLHGKAAYHSTLPAFLKEIKNFAQEHGCFLVRLDPSWSPQSPHSQFIKRITFAHKSPRERNPSHTLILPLQTSDQEMLKNMKSKWRYNINLAQKKGVQVSWDNTVVGAQKFYELMEKTQARQNFASYNLEYFTKLVEVLGKYGQGEFGVAELNGKTMAAIFIAYFGDHAYYLHGASDYEQRQVMAPHLLQWEAIKRAQQKNLGYYDFWGVAQNPPANAQEKALLAVTRFKTGFAPDLALTGYIGNYEMPVSRLLYPLYLLRQKLRG